MFTDLGRDIGYGARVLLRNPGFSILAIVALALGIGANITVFTLANAFLFKNLPFADSDRVLYVSNTLEGRSGVRSVSYPDFIEIQTRSREFDGVAAFVNRSVDLSDRSGFPERYRASLLTANAFSVLTLKPVRGRDFLPEDARPGAEPVAILSHALWEGRYAGDPAVIGRVIRVNDTPTAIVGVMAPGVTFPGATTLWMPFVRPADGGRRDQRTLTLFGRLASRASPASARAEMTAIARQLAAEYPSTNRNVGIAVQTFNDRFNSNDTARLLRSLLGAVAFVLLIACANVANLLLSRAIDRSREVSIRATLGASRWRVVRQLLVESLLLSTCAGIAGFVLAIWGVRIFDAALVPAVKPPYIDFSMDRSVFTYLLVITAGATVFFSLAPALQLGALDLAAALKEGTRSAGRGGHARLLSALLVVTEVALAVVLLAGAGLMIRSLLNTYRADIGVPTTNLMSMSLSLRNKKYPQVTDQILFHERLKSRLEAIPGMDVIEVASDLPAESPDDFAYEAEGGTPIEPENPPRSASLVVGADYFRVVQVPLRSGRPFTAADTVGSLPVVIVNERFARQAWPRQAAVGKRLRMVPSRRGSGNAAPAAPQPWLTVVGVVPDILQDDESFELSPVLYFPFLQQPQNGMEIMMRTRVPPATLGVAIRQAVQVLDEDIAVPALRTFEESLWFRNWRHRVFGSMFAIFAAIALLLASVGLYAVISHSVSQRTREIGVRMALGAVSGSILRLVFSQGMTQVAIGLVVGLGAALAATRALEAMLVGVTPADPLTFATVALVLIAAGALGCAIPARRAIRVDPVIALRNE